MRKRALVIFLIICFLIPVGCTHTGERESKFYSLDLKVFLEGNTDAGTEIAVSPPDDVRKGIFQAFDWTADDVLMWHPIEPKDSGRGWEFYIADVDFDGIPEMIISFQANHCGGNSLYLYKQDAGTVSHWADTFATPERDIASYVDYKAISPYMDTDLLDAYINEEGEIRYLSLDYTLFGGDERGGMGQITLYSTMFGEDAFPVKLAEISYCCPEGTKEFYFLGERVYGMDKLGALLDTYMDGYEEAEIDYRETGVVFPRDIVAMEEEEKAQRLEELYGVLENMTWETETASIQNGQDPIPDSAPSQPQPGTEGSGGGIELEAYGGGLSAKIQNEDDYTEFIKQLEKYTDCDKLSLDLSGRDVPVYLDEILTYDNFTYLTIENGGTILAREAEALGVSAVTIIELRHIIAIGENLLSRMPDLDTIAIELDSGYAGTLPTGEMMGNISCENIIMQWGSQGMGGEEAGSLNGQGVYAGDWKEWDYFSTALTGETLCLKGLYRLNEGDYSYTSYEFYEPASDREVSAAFICIKDRESNGEKYFDVLSIPEERLLDIERGDGQRFSLRDINFDGKTDILFYGNNPGVRGRNQIIGFLWDEDEKKYKFNETVPGDIWYIDTERERLTSVNVWSAFDEDYYIYEYNGSVFKEKRLEVRASEDKVTWHYYENGDFMKTLEMVFYESDGMYHVFYEEDGIAGEEVLMEEQAYYTNVGKRYFPEFDFYFVG